MPYVELNDDDDIERFAKRVWTNVSPSALVILFNRAQSQETIRDIFNHLLDYNMGRRQLRAVFESDRLHADPVYAPALNRLGMFEKASAVVLRDSQRHPGLVADLPGHTSDLILAKWVTDTGALATVSRESALLWRWDGAKFAPVHLPRRSAADALSASVSDNGQVLAIKRETTELHDLHVPDAVPAELALGQLEDDRQASSRLLVSRKGNCVAIPSARGGFTHVNVASSEQSVVHGPVVDILSTSGGGTHVAGTESRRGDLIVWRAPNPEPIARLERGEKIEGAIFSPNELAIASASRDRAVAFWEISSGAKIPTPELRPSKNIHDMINSPDGQNLFVLVDDRIDVWNWDHLQQGPNSLVSGFGQSGVGNLALSPSGRLLAAATRDSDVLVWDLSNPGAPPGRVPVSELRPTKIDIRDDGLLMVGYIRGYAQVWDTKLLPH